MRAKQYYNLTMIMLALGLTLLLFFYPFHSQPAQAIDDSNARLSVGFSHILYVDESGKLYSFGSNGDGQLGTGAYTVYDAQGNVVEDNDRNDWPEIMSDVRSVSAGVNFSLAVKEDGGLWAWGSNEYGQVGVSPEHNQGPANKFVTAPIKIMDNVTAASAGSYSSLALKEDGSVWAWGINTNAMIGDGRYAKVDFDKSDLGFSGQHTPTKVMDDVRYIATNYYTSAAIKNDGSLWVWGENISRQNFNSESGVILKPQKVMDDIKAVAIGMNCMMVIKTDNTLWAWGSNQYGQLGIGKDDIGSSTPAKVAENVEAIFSLEYTAQMRKTDGSLWVWGWNSGGRLGDGQNENRNSPYKLWDNVVMNALGYNYSLAALKDSDDLEAWGPQSGVGGVLLPTSFNTYDRAYLHGVSTWAKADVIFFEARKIVPEALLGQYTTAITRAEFAALIGNIYAAYQGEPVSAPTSFADISGNPYQRQIELCFNAQLVNGISATEFGPNRLISRQEAAKIMCTLIEQMEHLKAQSNYDNDFADKASIASWALPYVNYAIEQEILQGTGENKFSPLSNITREQSIVMLERMIIKYNWDICN